MLEGRLIPGFPGEDPLALTEAVIYLPTQRAARAFADADTVQVLDIYAASEEPIAGVDAPALVEAIRRTQYARVIGVP